jgi:segregation and condensation protein B
MTETADGADANGSNGAHRDGSGGADGAGASSNGASTGGALACDAGAVGNGRPDLAALIEGVLFVTDGPVTVAALARALDVSRVRVDRGLQDLAAVYGGQRRGVRLQRTNGHVQLVSAPEVAGVIERYLGLEATSHLSRAALEALSIIAYRQPVTRPEIDEVRGVNSEGVLRTVISRGLVELVGRRATVGHPFEYGTTFLFLEYFGLTGLDELPPVEPLAMPIDVEDAERSGNGSGGANGALGETGTT